MKQKRWLVSTLCFIMTGSLCACGGGGTTAPSSEAGGETTTAAETTAAGTTELAEGGKYICSDTPLTLTAHINWNDTIVLTDSMIIPKEAERFTNITLQGVESEMDTDSAQAFKLMITGKTLPDLVGVPRTDINHYGVEGDFIPLNDMI